MKKIGEFLIRLLAKVFKINLLGLAYKKRGVGLPNDPVKNGEHHFINKILPNLVRQKQPVFIDAGANKGEYTQLLLQKFPDAFIHSFEANPVLIPFLKERFGKYENVSILNCALSSKKGEVKLFIKAEDKTTGHASLHQEVLKELHGYKKIEQITTESVCLDDYCNRHEIEFIDFLKLDIEGHEFEALKGALAMLPKTKVIQLEFNEMNISSRVFLKDFYDLLKDFSFYRLVPTGLFPLGNYSSKSEVFIIQNLLAVNNIQRQ